MPKVDFKQEYKHLYLPSAKEVVPVEVPGMNFLMLDGTGDPNGSDAYQAAVETLFTLSYTIKFMLKKGPQAIDYGVMPLEGLWWADDMAAFSTADRTAWKWTMMIMQPGIVTSAFVSAAITEVRRKKELANLSEVRFATLHEGTCAQIMHIGPFAAEGPTIARVHRFIADSGRQRVGKHHEIYLSDIRKADPQKWRTVIRQPMR